MTQEELDSCIAPGKEFYTDEDVMAVAAGTGWVLKALIGTDHIRPIKGSDDKKFSPADFNRLVEWRRRGIIVGKKISEGHERRRCGFPVSNALPKDYKVVSGVVYLIECAGRYKIGKTENLPVRIAAFQIILPYAPVIIHQIKSSNITQTERDLHVEYKDKRVRGEWFDLTQEDIDRIKQMG